MLWPNNWVSGIPPQIPAIRSSQVVRWILDYGGWWFAGGGNRIDCLCSKNHNNWWVKWRFLMYGAHSRKFFDWELLRWRIRAIKEMTCIFLILRWLRDRPHRNGEVFLFYVFFYSLMRFFVENAMSQSGLISLKRKSYSPKILPYNWRIKNIKDKTMFSLPLIQFFNNTANPKRLFAVMVR